MSQPIRVMLVDDSAIVRGLMQRAIKADTAIEIVATAVDGQMAIDVLKRTPVDVIILDIEMPVMDGLSALPGLLKIAPRTRILMVSTLTLRNAEIGLRAIALGAADYVAKPSAREPAEIDQFYRELIDKIKALHPSGAPASATPRVPAKPAAKPAVAPPLAGMATAIAIASSTGGPQALLHIFRQLKGRPLRVPVFITQHMPPDFTTILASHIANAGGFDCHEAKEGEEVRSGSIYLAPGNYHMTVSRHGATTLHLNQDAPENFCRPSADPMLRSLAAVYGRGLLVAVLTGIGADGTKGAAVAVAEGGQVIAQDEASSVVYGMPKAVAEAKLVRAVLPLDEIAAYLSKAMA